MKSTVRCGETISEEHLGALPQFSIIGVHMPISPSARPPHLLAIQKDDGWFAAGSADQVPYHELVETIRTTGPAVLLWIPGQKAIARTRQRRNYGKGE